MRYRLAIFDFDGTLADSFPWFLELANVAAAKYRFRRIEPAEVDLLRGYGARDIVRHLGISAWKLPFIAAHLRRWVARQARPVPLFPGVPAMLGRLEQAGVTLAVVTSNSEQNVRNALGPELTRKLRHLSCGASMFGKRARFRQVVARAGARRDETLCIGDELRDLDAARAEGLAFGAVSWGYTLPSALEAGRPEELFRTVEEIADRLTR